LCESLELEKCQLRDEIKESKVRESQQLQDCTELEEENIALQKLVSMLRENQVEFEGLKHEMKQREEDIEILHSQLEEATRLRGIVERQLEEALETVRTEREQKNALRKELSANTSGSFCNLHGGLEELHFDDSTGQDELDSGYHQGSSHLNGEVRVSTPRAGQPFRPAPGLVSDLFSELSLSEMQKLKQQLVQAEREKATLLASVQELQKRLEAACCGGLLPEAARRAGEGEEAKYQEALAEVAQLKAELRELQGKYLECEGRYQEEQEHWRLESRELAENIELHVKCSREDQECIARLQKEVRAVAKVAADSQGGLGRAQDELAALSEELAGLYHHVCLCNNVTPNRVTLDYFKGSRSRAGPQLRRRRSSDLFGRAPAEHHDGGSSSSGGDLSPRSLPSSPVPEAADPQREPLNVLSLSAVIRSQIKHLQAVVELSRQRAALQLLAPGTDKDKEALIEEVLKLKSLLSTKREQIATLRTVLKANKQTAEVALSNLKSKYDNEKCLVSDTMVKLRNELKALKEDAATFSSLRSMFAS
ncbi:protein bicaudal D homolog 1-like, partial [Cetorhinus maximus]